MLLPVCTDSPRLHHGKDGHLQDVNSPADRLGHGAQEEHEQGEDEGVGDHPSLGARVLLEKRLLDGEDDADGRNDVGCKEGFRSPWASLLRRDIPHRHDKGRRVEEGTTLRQINGSPQ